MERRERKLNSADVLGFVWFSSGSHYWGQCAQPQAGVLRKKFNFRKCRQDNYREDLEEH